MVNHGVSRACENCKRKRKKCDETRPACHRCRKANITCPGYKDEADLVFRSYTRTTDELPPHAPAEISPRDPAQSFPTPPETPQHLQNDQIQQHALAVFFHDFCVPSTDRTLSRGYLDGLEALYHHAAPSSDISLACRLVAFASLGTRLNRPHLLEYATAIYAELLQSFRKTIADPNTANTVESLMTSVLLGLYETVTADESHPGYQGTHLRGVAAILSTDRSPFDLRYGARLFRVTNSLVLKGPLEQTQGVRVLCAPSSNPSALSLDAIIMKAHPASKRIFAMEAAQKKPSLDEIREIKRELWSLNHDFRQWPASQPKEWEPRVIGSTVADTQQLAGGLKWWVGDAESYFDLYVAAVWNTYRKSHLLLLYRLWNYSKQLGDIEDCIQHQADAEELAKGLVASIPYHLVKNPEVLERKTGAVYQNFVINSPVGGLLLMYPLHVVSRLSIVSTELRAHLRECLRWIATNMGIGQANLLAQEDIDRPTTFLAEGHVLIWAGMLIQPE